MSADTLVLRDYQREAIDAVFAAWSGGMRRPAIVLPTGAGKTVVFSALVREYRARHESMGPQSAGPRVMILAHRDELVDQAIAKLRAVMPGVNVGKVKAQDNEIHADVMVCSVQTLATPSGRRIAALQGSEWGSGDVGLIITDECHHAAAASYGKIYDAFPDALQLGVTATMARGDGVGLGKVWEEVVYKRSILNLIGKGHLTDVRTKQITLNSLDLSDVKRTFARAGNPGDFQAGDLGRALMDAEADTAIARAYKEHAGDRQGIVFTPTVETAHAAWKALVGSGIRAAVVSGDTPAHSRRFFYEEFRTGRVQVLVNCMVLTEGFDAPWAEVAVIARPTQSAPLYTQMVGRVLRPWPGKKEALVLDLVGASANKLRTLIDLQPGEVQEVRDGESLEEAAEREEKERESTAPGGTGRFAFKVKDVVSFGASEYAWKRTPKGVLFISCGGTKVLLWPAQGDAGLWDVVVATKGEKWYRSSHTDLDLGSAMAWGEAVAEDYASFGITTSASWRKKPVSDKQKTLALRLGVPVEGRRAGEISDDIDVILSGRDIDQYVKG